MNKKALTKTKMMTKICIGISLAANVVIVPMAASTAASPAGYFEYFNLPFLAMILAIVLSFGAILGELFFKLITPQKHYIEKAKADLAFTEFFWSCAWGIAPYVVIINVYF